MCFASKFSGRWLKRRGRGGGGEGGGGAENTQDDKIFHLCTYSKTGPNTGYLVDYPDTLSFGGPFQCRTNGNQFGNLALACTFLEFLSRFSFANLPCFVFPKMPPCIKFDLENLAVEQERLIVTQ